MTNVQQTKKHIFLFVFILVFFSAVSFYLYEYKPWKVTDPADPNFDVTQFNPNDYLNHTELALALGQLLKPNISSKNDLDKLWCEKSPCGQDIATIPNFKNSRLDLCLSKIGNNPSKQKIYWYAEKGKSPIFPGWNLWAFYNNNDHLVKLCADDVLVF